MLAEPDGPFVDVSKLNIAKYANKPDLAKVFHISIGIERYVCMYVCV